MNASQSRVAIRKTDDETVVASLGSADGSFAARHFRKQDGSSFGSVDIHRVDLVSANIRTLARGMETVQIVTTNAQGERCYVTFYDLNVCDLIAALEEAVEDEAAEEAV